MVVIASRRFDVCRKFVDIRRLSKPRSQSVRGVCIAHDTYGNNNDLWKAQISFDPPS